MLEPWLPVVQLAAFLSTIIMMFSIGLGLTLKDISYFRHKKRLFIKSITAVLILVPIAVYVIILIFKPEPAVAAIMIVLSVSPAAPGTFIRIPKAGGGEDYVISLNLILAMLAIVSAPILLTFFDMVPDINLSINPYNVAKQVLITILLPLTLGAITRKAVPDISMDIKNRLLNISEIMMLIAICAILIATLDDIVLKSLQSYLAMIFMVISSLAIGHILSSSIPEERTTLALECAWRNPGLALLIASVNYPDKNAIAIFLPYFVIFLIASTIYRHQRKVMHSEDVNKLI